MEELGKFLASYEFTSPLYFWVGAALVLLAIFIPLSRRRRRFAIDLQYWKTRVAFKSKRVWVFSILVLVTSILMAAILADPQTLAQQSIRIYGKPVMLVIDVSGSMETAPQVRAAPGGGPADTRNSFEKARDVFNGLIGRSPDVNLGLELFSTENYIARYFTYKNELFKDTLENTDEISFTSTGTRIAEALATAHRFLMANFPHTRDSEPNSAIVLVSDLDADSDELAQTADEIERAHWAGINTYVIRIEPQTDQGGSPQSLPLLNAVDIVGMNDAEGIDRIVGEIAQLPSSLIREEETVSRTSLIPVLSSTILALVVLCLVLSETRFRKIP